MSTPSPNKRIRTRAERVAARVSYDNLFGKTSRLLFADEGLKKTGLVLIAALIISVICCAWDPPNPSRSGIRAERNLVSRAKNKQKPSADSGDTTYDKISVINSRSTEYLHTMLKALIASRLYGTEYYYRVMIDEDEGIKVALKDLDL